MRELSDPDNPYRGRYEPWDEWCYQHARDLDRDLMMAWYQGEAPRGWELIRLYVDKDGFVVPRRLSYTEDQQRRHESEFEPQLDCRFVLRGGGMIDPDLYQAMLGMQAAIRAPYLPPVPKWLADAPPRSAQLMPGGEVVTLGPPGRGESVPLPRANYAVAEDARVYYRFDAEGRLLGKGEPEQPWYKLYFADFDEVLGQLEERQMWWQHNGYIYVNDTQTREFLAVYDYDGTPLTDDPAELYGRRSRFVQLTRREIPLLFEAQQQD